MATPKPQYKRGKADTTGTQLPKGGAQTANEATAVADQGAGGENLGGSDVSVPQEQPYVPQEVEFAPGPQPEHPQMPPNETEQMLFGPSDRPLEKTTTGALPPGKNPLPADMHKWLPIFTEAAQDPDAPEMLKNMFKLLTYQMNKDQF